MLNISANSCNVNEFIGENMVDTDFGGATNTLFSFGCDIGYTPSRDFGKMICDDSGKSIQRLECDGKCSFRSVMERSIQVQN